MMFIMDKKKGLLGYLGLKKWYLLLSDLEKTRFIKLAGSEQELLRDETWTSQAPATFLWCLGGNALSSKDYSLSEKILMKALRVKGDILDKHFIYITLIKLYYRQRNISKGALEKCIYYCQEDIKNFPKFKKAWIKDERRQGLKKSELYIPRVPSFERLAIIYEKQRRLSEAMEVCKKAIECKLDGGFENRLKKLKKKSEKKGGK